MGFSIWRRNGYAFQTERFGYNIKVVLPVLLFVVTVIVAKNDYFGKGKWFCIAGTAGCENNL